MRQYDRARPRSPVTALSLVVFGVDHSSADLDVLERCAVPSDELGKALTSLSELEHVLEVTLLSTCNRLEVYAHLSRFHDGLEEIKAWMADRAGVSTESLDGPAYAWWDDSAAEHLFAVASGLESMVVGEQQIASQVRDAMETARDLGASRGVLQRLFEQALRASRRVRHETEIGLGASSIVDVGLEAAARRLEGGWAAGRTALIVGAGEIGALTADRLAADGIGQLLVWNRSADKAQRIARRADGAVVFDLAEGLAASDLVVCTTGAAQPVITADDVSAALARRDSTDALVLLDLAVPRNIDPGCARIAGVDVIDIRTVRDTVRRTVAAEVIADARALVAEEAAAFQAWIRAAEVEPTIRALRESAEDVRRAELDRLAGRLGDLDARQRETIEALSRGIVNTLLHRPTIKLKELAEHGGAEHHANALRELFDLEDDEPTGPA